jgi:hypothetical protein
VTLGVLTARGCAAGVGAALALAALGIPASASAQPPAPESISIDWAAVTPPPTSPPFRGIGAGTFAATGVVTDSGTLEGTIQEVAVSSPKKAIRQIFFTLTSDAGTLAMRCKETATDFSDPTSVPNSGTCAITGGTGVYANLQGQGTIISTLNVLTRSETATIALGVV